MIFGMLCRCRSSKVTAECLKFLLWHLFPVQFSTVTARTASWSHFLLHTSFSAWILSGWPDSTRSLLPSFGLWMRRHRPWPSTESFSRVSRWRLEDLTTTGLYLVSQSSRRSTSQVSHRAPPRNGTPKEREMICLSPQASSPQSFQIPPINCL